MSELIGYLLTIDAIISWGLASLVYKYSLKNVDAQATILFRLILVTLSTFFFSLMFGSYIIFSTLDSVELIDYLIACIVSGVSVTVGDILYFFSLKKIDASRAFPLTSLSLVFVYPFAAIFFGEEITLNILIGGILILSSVFLLSAKDVPDENNPSENGDDESLKSSEDLFIGTVLAIGTAFFWALSILSFNQARIVASDVFITNFFRILFASIFIVILGFFKRDYHGSFKKENRENLKYFAYIGIAGALSLGFADSLFYLAVEYNGLIITSTFTANTPLVQQIFSILILKEKFRKKFLIAVGLIIVGNYIILFM